MKVHHEVTPCSSTSCTQVCKFSELTSLCECQRVGLDDPLEVADVLGPYVVATHCKDFAIEENSRGFRFTMVPFGSGSLHFKEITARLLKHLRPEVVFSIEMMTDQNFEVPWILDRFWTAYRNKSGRQVAAALRHIRTKAIDPEHCISQDEVDALPHQRHLELEQKNLQHCIGYLRQTLAELGNPSKA